MLRNLRPVLVKYGTAERVYLDLADAGPAGPVKAEIEPAELNAREQGKVVQRLGHQADLLTGDVRRPVSARRATS